MKKWIVMLLTLTLVLQLGACGKKESDIPGQSAMEALPGDAAPGQIVAADFTDKAAGGEYDTVEALAQALSEGSYLPFAGAYMAVEEGWLNGFTEEITGFQEGYMFGPSIGSIPFIGYVFVLEDAGKADAFVDHLKSCADLRWNICTAADSMDSAVVGDKVCFVMSPASFEE